jgi:thioredoxin-like negative regulator of GroEL
MTPELVEVLLNTAHKTQEAGSIIARLNEGDNLDKIMALPAEQHFIHKADMLLDIADLIVMHEALRSHIKAAAKVAVESSEGNDYEAVFGELLGAADLNLRVAHEIEKLTDLIASKS